MLSICKWDKETCILTKRKPQSRNLVLEDVLAKILLLGISESLLPMFSSRTLKVSWLNIWVFHPFRFYFGVWYKLLSRFIFCTYQSSSLNTIYWRGYFYSIVCSCPLCQILISHRDMALFLGSLFCSIDLYICSNASTRLIWSHWPCSTVWYQVLGSLLLHSSFWRLLRLFRLFSGSIYIFEIFVVYLWNMSLVFLLRFYIFIFRESGREKEGEKHQCVVASHLPPTGDLAHNPGTCSDWELNQWLFGLQASTQSTEPHQPGPYLFFNT